MVLIIGAALISFLPTVFLLLWFKKRIGLQHDETYDNAYKIVLKKGFITILLVIACSALFAVIEGGLGFLLKGPDSYPLLFAAYHTFIVLALSEELVKTFQFYSSIKKMEYKYTWLDMIIFMTTIGLCFGLLESILYVVGADVIQILVRGVMTFHGGLGFIEGWFYGLAKVKGKKWYAVLGFLIAWIIHGAYDFGLSEEFLTLGEYAPFLSVNLAILAVIIFIVMIVFFFTVKKKEKYLKPLD
ncbi:MAG: PrsW family intramembrane metalloprotease [Solobacterium sp.]|nr:PrsW family intramembrane metalloprotease [Solobacterium sp.]